MEKTRVRDAMSAPVVCVPPDCTVPAAAALMRQHRLRHLPVVQDGRLIGIVSRGDLREASSKEAINADNYEINFMLNRLKLADIMTRKVLTITPEAFIVDAVELMVENQVAGLPVVALDGAVIGIITESDLLKLLLAKLKKNGAAVAEQGPANGDGGAGPQA